MSGYRLTMAPEVLAFLTRLDTRIFRQVTLRILRLLQDPRPHDSEQLRGFRDPESGRPGYRIDQGEYRILYAVDHEARVVGVFRVGHRRDVYRGLT